MRVIGRLFFGILLIMIGGCYSTTYTTTYPKHTTRIYVDNSYRYRHHHSHSYVSIHVSDYSSGVHIRHYGNPNFRIYLREYGNDHVSIDLDF